MQIAHSVNTTEDGQVSIFPAGLFSNTHAQVSPTPQKRPSLLHIFLSVVTQLIFLIRITNEPPVYHNTFAVVFFSTYHCLKSP